VEVAVADGVPVSLGLGDVVEVVGAVPVTSKDAKS
jgi:hypothetical protein